jgi:hypothetical protein
MNMELWWDDTDTGKAEVLGKKPVPVPQCADYLLNHASGVMWNSPHWGYTKRQGSTVGVFFVSSQWEWSGW